MSRPMDKIGAEKVGTLLVEDLGLTRDQAGEILTFIAIKGDNQTVLAALEGYRGRSEVFDQGLDELKTVVKYLSAFGVAEEKFAVDLTIARGLTTTPAPCTRPLCWTTRRSAASVPGGGMIT